MRTPKKRDRGTAMTELALLAPILFLLFLSLVQVIIYFQSATMTQYAAFMAARSYQVYGPRDLGSIDYENLRSAPYTNKDQTIAEAVAEKILFESLMWEHGNIELQTSGDYGDRVYKDGNDLSKNGIEESSSRGAVRVNLIKGLGVEVTYCVPLIAPGITTLFDKVMDERPCRSNRAGKKYSGIAIRQVAKFGIEPEVSP